MSLMVAEQLLHHTLLRRRNVIFCVHGPWGAVSARQSYIRIAQSVTATPFKSNSLRVHNSFVQARAGCSRVVVATAVAAAVVVGGWWKKEGRGRACGDGSGDCAWVGRCEWHGQPCCPASVQYERD